MKLLLVLGFCLSFSTLKVVAEKIPEPECISSRGFRGETACGYDCVRSLDGDEVACAEWPEGKCKAAFDSVACGPPAPSGWHDRYENNDEFGDERENKKDSMKNT